MKLITKQIENRLAKYPLYSQDGKGDNATIVCKFFLASWTWYVLEARKEANGDYLFYGIVDNGHEREHGYFRLSELESLRVWGCVKVERDMYFDPITIAKCNEFNS
jgi:hypothetical protein